MVQSVPRGYTDSLQGWLGSALPPTWGGYLAAGDCDVREGGTWVGSTFLCFSSVGSWRPVSNGWQAME